MLAVTRQLVIRYWRLVVVLFLLAVGWKMAGNLWTPLAVLVLVAATWALLWMLKRRHDLLAVGRRAPWWKLPWWLVKDRVRLGWTVHRWRLAMESERLTKGTDKWFPFLLGPTTTIDGDVTALVQPAKLGIVVDDIRAHKDRIGEIVRAAGGMRVRPIPGRVGECSVQFYFTDSLSRFLPVADMPCPAVRKEGEPYRITYGVRQSGEPATIDSNLSLLIGGTTGSGKALALDTKVPTPSGWTTMGELTSGDVVYSETGQPTTVTDAWEVRVGRPCFRVCFSDGSHIVADAEHQWTVETASSRASMANAARPKRGGKFSRDQTHSRSLPVTLTTEELAADVHVAGTARLNYSIPVAGPLAGSGDLLVPAYTLGVWLGDGTAVSSNITTADPEMLLEIESEGFVTSKLSGLYHYHVAVPAVTGRTVCTTSSCPALSGPGRDRCAAHARNATPCVECGAPTRGATCAACGRSLRATLRRIGVLGNKHIPVNYLRAGEVDRRALLAGLLDSDGYCSPSGTAEFTNTNEQLARDVFHLVAGLGYQPRLRHKTALLYGVPCGTVWTVSFTAADKVFRLTRKLARQHVGSVRVSATRRFITAVEPVASVPVRCIAVDAPSHLFLVGDACIATHNSSTAWDLLADVLRQRIPIQLHVSDAKGGIELGALDRVGHEQHGDSLFEVVKYTANAKDAVPMVNAVLKILRDRQVWQREHRVRKLFPTIEMPWVLLILDELLPLHEMIKKSTEGALGTILFEGRASHVTVWANAQMGHAAVLGELRNLIPQRICLATTSPQTTNTILGDGAAQLGAHCHKLDVRFQAGLGWSVNERSELEKFRAGYVGDEPRKRGGSELERASDVDRIAMGVLPRGMLFADQVEDVAAPERVAVYRPYIPVDGADRLAYVGVSNKPGRRRSEHRRNDVWKSGPCPVCAELRCRWWVKHVEPALKDDPGRWDVAWFGSDAEARVVETAAIVDELPIFNVVHNQGNVFGRRTRAVLRGRGRRRREARARLVDPVVVEGVVEDETSAELPVDDLPVAEVPAEPSWHETITKPRPPAPTPAPIQDPTPVSDKAAPTVPAWHDILARRVS